LTAAFSHLPSTAAAAAVPRPRAIKSQHSQPPQQMPDAILQQQQQQALQHDLLKADAAKLAEASKLAERGYVVHDMYYMLQSVMEVVVQKTLHACLPL